MPTTLSIWVLTGKGDNITVSHCWLSTSPRKYDLRENQRAYIWGQWWKNSACNRYKPLESAYLHNLLQFATPTVLREVTAYLRCMMKRSNKGTPQKSMFDLVHSLHLGVNGKWIHNTAFISPLWGPEQLLKSKYLHDSTSPWSQPIAHIVRKQ